jgi:hypothetical protein
MFQCLLNSVQLIFGLWENNDEERRFVSHSIGNHHSIVWEYFHFLELHHQNIFQGSNKIIHITQESVIWLNCSNSSVLSIQKISITMKSRRYCESYEGERHYKIYDLELLRLNSVIPKWQTSPRKDITNCLCCCCEFGCWRSKMDDRLDLER